jgi:hypothetical protein
VVKLQSCGHKGCDYYAEYRPGSLEGLANTLREIGFKVSVEPCATLEASQLGRCLLATSNAWRSATEVAATSTIPTSHAIICLGIILYSHFCASSSDLIIIVAGGHIVIVAYAGLTMVFDMVMNILFGCVRYHPRFILTVSSTMEPTTSSVPRISGHTFVSQSSHSSGSTSSSQTQTLSSSGPAQQKPHYRPSPQIPQNPTSTGGAQPSISGWDISDKTSRP